MSSDLKKAGEVAKVAFFIILIVSISEISVALLSRSVGMLADGVTSLSTAAILLIMWIGLRVSGRSPDGTFHFGYYRVEALGSLITAFILAVFAGLILFESYLEFVHGASIVNPNIAIFVALAVAAATGLVSWKIERTSRKYGFASLRVGLFTGVIDVLSSIGVALGIFFWRYFGIATADSIVGISIGITIFVGAYSILRESSLVLLDACSCGDVVEAIGEIAKSVKGTKEVHSIRMRRLGSYLAGDLHIVVDDNMLVKEADEIATKVEEKIKREMRGVIDIKVRIESDKGHDNHSKEIDIKTTKPV